MSTEPTPTTDEQPEDAVEFGCWKWIFLGLIILGIIVVGYLVLL